MNIFDVIKQRRAIKHYDADHELTDHELRTLLSAAALAPTSFNMQNRHFVAVVDQKQKDQLQAAAWGQEHVRDASVVVVITGDLKAYRRTDRYLRNAPPAVREQFEPLIAQFYEGNDSLLRDEACRSVGMAAMNLMLAAQGLGHESCPMIGFDPAQVSKVVGLDEDHPPLMLVVVGKGTKPAWPRLGLLNLEELVSIDRFGGDSMSGEIES
ncbi:MAG: nitroreductase family protein [Fuerstiella sp.]|nr:nitroreductase family protein [Fuerstiella sp.]MCP4854366.1 nitroreductase family protein [Fuerstiella sp.]